MGRKTVREEKIIADFFEKEHIEYYASLALSSLIIINPRRIPVGMEGATLFLIPYDDGSPHDGNISRYAVPRDYHLYITELSERFAAFLEKSGEHLDFSFAADTSPILEHDAAVKANLGFEGKNHLILNERYGSYIFIGALFTKEIPTLCRTQRETRRFCNGCGRCLAACPAKCAESGDFSTCLSALTQKKRLSAEEEQIVARHTLCWGCDICQEVCPHNRGAAATPIEFFRRDRLTRLTAESLSEMREDEFLSRAYAWRGRAVVERNLRLQSDKDSITENNEKIKTEDAL